jgi:integrase
MIYKKGRYYMVKFMWQGKLIRKSTRSTTKKDARSIEGTIRSELAKGNFGILETKPTATVNEFLKADFLPFTETKFASKQKTSTYYKYGASMLMGAELGKLKLSEITNQQANQFIASHSNLSVATTNCGLRTLRRALALAVEWGKLDRMPKISLAKGERQRERVVTDDEVTKYLGKCPQPWHDAVIVMLGKGMRPGEVFPLRWENTHINGNGGLICILEGKSKAARRMLPMMPEIYRTLKARHESQGFPLEGWVFPSGSKSGHLQQGTAKKQHAKALKDSGVQAFEPYCLRHTALTNLGHTCDGFTLARIAGHSSISITQRYIHPQADAIERAFAKMASSRQLVTEGGHPNIETVEAEMIATVTIADN